MRLFCVLMHLSKITPPEAFCECLSVSSHPFTNWGRRISTFHHNLRMAGLDGITVIIWSRLFILQGQEWSVKGHTVGCGKTLKVKVKVKSLSSVHLFATPWTLAHQAPPSMGFSRQEYWSGLPFSQTFLSGVLCTMPAFTWNPASPFSKSLWISLKQVIHWSKRVTHTQQGLFPLLERNY